MYWIHDINPEILHIWGIFGLRWYPLAYIAGLTLAYFGMRRLVSLGYLMMKKNDIEDLWFYLALGVIIGGRVGYILIYDLSNYIRYPLSIFKVWEGGMSFHGGFVGVLAATYYFCRKKKMRMSTLLGAEALLAPAGLFFGRIANFINGELWGKPTAGNWGVVFPEAGPLPRHPTQLYEAFLEGIVLFFILYFLLKKTKDLRVLGPCFGVAYGVFRIIIEFFRVPDTQIGYLAFGFVTMGQLLSVGMIIFSIYILKMVKGGRDV